MTATQPQPQPTFKRTSFGVVTSDHNTREGAAMLKTAGADFTVEKVNVSYPKQVEKTTPDGQKYMDTEMVPMKASAVIRSDTGETINENATVGKDFTVVQNSEVIEIIDAICLGHDLSYKYMTVAGGGAGLIVQVYSEDLNKALGVGKDRNEGYLSISNFHDGTGSLKVHVSMLRLFCANVLPALNREYKSARRNKVNGVYSIRHSKRMEDRINEMVASYRDAMGDLEETAHTLNLLANKKCSKKEQEELFWRVINADGKDEKDLSKRAKAQRESKFEALKALRSDRVNKVADAAGTWYEALQPITAYGTRGARVRKTGRVSVEESRFNSAHFGSGAKFSATGLALAVEMSGV